MAERNSWAQRQEFISANRRLIETIAQHLEVQLAYNQHRVMLYSARWSPFGFVEGEPQAEYYQDSFDESWPATPEEYAEEEKRSLLQEAQSMTGHYLHIADCLRPQDQPPEITPDDDPRTALMYDHAVYRISYFGDDDPTVRGRLSAFEAYNISGATPIEAFTAYDMSWSHDGITDGLAVMVVNGVPQAIRHWAHMTDDALYDRCHDMFGPESKAMDLLFGRYADDAEFDSALQSIAAATKGIYPDDEVQAVLAALQERVQAKKQSEMLRDTFDLNQPSALKLQEFIDCLASFEQ